MHRSAYHDDPTMQVLLGVFTKRLGEQVRELRGLVATGDAEGVRRVAHQLKGAGKSYGFAAITDLAAVVERKISETKSLSGAMSDIENLIAFIQDVEGYRAG